MRLFWMPRNANAQQYDRLYFDLNRNGDLTDDKPIEARPRGLFSGGSAEFPRVDLTLDVEGTKLDYSFFVTAYSPRYQGFCLCLGLADGGRLSRGRDHP